MRDDSYRRPAARPVETKPRGIVVRRADEPDELEAAEERRRQAALRERSILARAEYEQAQRSVDRRVRGTGLVLITIGVVLSAVAIFAIGAGDHRPGSATVAAPMLLTGAWALLVGAGRAPTFASIPTWVTNGGALALALGLLWGTSGYADLLAIFAR